jgi:ketopantoate reductase
VLEQLPDNWRNNTVLLQNELLPRDWAPHHLVDPTVISVWFEKKKGQDYKVLIPSPAFGPKATLLQQALATLDIPCRVLNNDTELLHELVLKNVYIITTNVAGLVTGGTVSQLWANHQELCSRIVNEVINIQEWLTGEQFDRQQLIKDMLVAFDGDPDHNCMGRSAPARLQRALALADEAGLDVTEMRNINNKQ